jgi:exonuclease SbcC
VFKDKTSVVNELQEGLNNANFDPSNDFTNKINELEDIKSKMELKIRAIVDELNNKKIDELKRVQDNYLSVANSIEAEYQAELSRIQAERNNKLETAKENLEKSKTEITKENENIIAEKQSAFNVKYQPLLSQITEYKERQKLYAGYEKQNALLNQFVIEKQEMAAKSESLTEQLNILENIKSQMLAKLPIDGLEIIDGQIYRHGVIFDRLNTAQQMDIAIEVAKLRAGEIGVVCVDGLERFDNDTYELFKNKMMESNLQLFVTKVDNGELEINGKMFQLN